MADDPEAEIQVTCTCGWQTRGRPDDAVAATQEHGRKLHNMEASRDQVMAMARPAED